MGEDFGNEEKKFVLVWCQLNRRPFELFGEIIEIAQAKPDPIDIVIRGYLAI
jgi:hypothetical protein